MQHHLSERTDCSFENYLLAVGNFVEFWVFWAELELKWIYYFVERKKQVTVDRGISLIYFAAEEPFEVSERGV
jgi:hypothetical protein